MDLTGFALPEPQLRREAIRLRPFRAEDALEVAEACRDPLIPKFTMMADGLTEQDAAKWIERTNERWSDGDARFAIVDLVSDHVLGQVGMFVHAMRQSAEAYYWVAKDARGRGVATSALGLVADWAFDVIGVERLFLLTHQENIASQRVAEHCGFSREGILRSYMRTKEGRPDLVCWSLLPTDSRPWLEK